MEEKQKTPAASLCKFLIALLACLAPPPRSLLPISYPFLFNLDTMGRTLADSTSLRVSPLKRPDLNGLDLPMGSLNRPDLSGLDLPPLRGNQCGRT